MLFKSQGLGKTPTGIIEVLNFIDGPNKIGNDYDLLDYL
jgi:hypothetical protein